MENLSKGQQIIGKVAVTVSLSPSVVADYYGVGGTDVDESAYRRAVVDELERLFEKAEYVHYFEATWQTPGEDCGDHTVEVALSDGEDYRYAVDTDMVAEDVDEAVGEAELTLTLEVA